MPRGYHFATADATPMPLSAMREAHSLSASFMRLCHAYSAESRVISVLQCEAAALMTRQRRDARWRSESVRASSAFSCRGEMLRTA